MCVYMNTYTHCVYDAYTLMCIYIYTWYFCIYIYITTHMHVYMWVYIYIQNSYDKASLPMLAATPKGVAPGRPAHCLVL